MNLNLFAFLIGLFAVPCALLWWSHGVRRMSPRRRGAFWGAIVGHCVAGILVVTVGVIIPEAWTAGDTMRGAAGFWTMLLFPLLGGATGAIVSTSNR